MNSVLMYSMITILIGNQSFVIKSVIYYSHSMLGLECL